MLTATVSLHIGPFGAMLTATISLHIGPFRAMLTADIITFAILVQMIFRAATSCCG